MCLGELSQGRTPLFKSVFNRKGQFVVSVYLWSITSRQVYYMAMAASYGTEAGVIMFNQYEM